MSDVVEQHEVPTPKSGFGTEHPNSSFDAIVKQEQGDVKDDVYSRANPPRPGFTKADQKHMYRMGKVQELKVRVLAAGQS